MGSAYQPHKAKLSANVGNKPKLWKVKFVSNRPFPTGARSEIAPSPSTLPSPQASAAARQRRCRYTDRPGVDTQIDGASSSLNLSACPSRCHGLTVHIACSSTSTRATDSQTGFPSSADSFLECPVGVQTKDCPILLRKLPFLCRLILGVLSTI